MAPGVGNDPTSIRFNRAPHFAMIAIPE